MYSVVKGVKFSSLPRTYQLIHLAQEFIRHGTPILTVSARGFLKTSSRVVHASVFRVLKHPLLPSCLTRQTYDYPVASGIDDRLPHTPQECFINFTRKEV